MEMFDAFVVPSLSKTEVPTTVLAGERTLEPFLRVMPFLKYLIPLGAVTVALSITRLVG